jgi:hypothetical protein
MKTIKENKNMSNEDILKKKILLHKNKINDYKYLLSIEEENLRSISKLLIDDLKTNDNWDVLINNQHAFKYGKMFHVYGNILYQHFGYSDGDTVTGIVIDLTKSFKEQIEEKVSELKLKEEKSQDEIKEEEIALYHKIKEKYNL